MSFRSMISLFLTFLLPLCVHGIEEGIPIAITVDDLPVSGALPPFTALMMEDSFSRGPA